MTRDCFSSVCKFLIINMLPCRRGTNQLHMPGRSVAHCIATRCTLYSSLMANKRIAVIPGDGIGKEVIPAALQVIEASGAPVEFTHFDWSADRYLKDGVTIPADGFAMLADNFDAIF